MNMDKCELNESSCNKKNAINQNAKNFILIKKNLRKKDVIWWNFHSKSRLLIRKPQKGLHIINNNWQD